MLAEPLADALKFGERLDDHLKRLDDGGRLQPIRTICVRLHEVEDFILRCSRQVDSGVGPRR
jgi:hypothetical protein